jgi:hypothetical protein
VVSGRWRQAYIMAVDTLRGPDHMFTRLTRPVDEPALTSLRSR